MKNKKTGDEPNRIITLAVLLLMVIGLMVVFVFDRKPVKSNEFPAVSMIEESNSPPEENWALAAVQTGGDELVFARQGWIYYLNTSTQIPAQKLAEGIFPSLSPDKKQVVYLHPRISAESVLMRLDLASGKSTELRRIEGYVNYPRWSPAGDLILFVVSSNGRSRLEKINADGTNRQTIISDDDQFDNIFSPVWAADGKSVFFHNMNHLFRFSLEGEVLEKTALTEILGDEKTIMSSDWFVPSPKDENLLVFTQFVKGSLVFETIFGEPITALFLYDFKKCEKKRLTPDDLLAIDPVWSRDGRYIYFTGYCDREGRVAYPFAIYRIKPDGTDLIKIGKGENPSL